MKDKILYIGGFELPDKNAAAHRVINNGKVFTKLGYKVQYIGITNSSIPGQIEYPKTILQWFIYVTSIEKIIKAITEDKNIGFVICYNYPAIALYKLIKFCAKKDIKVIGDITEWYEDKRIVKKIDTWLRMRIINKLCDGLICISSYLYNMYKDTIPCLVIPPLIDKSDKHWFIEESKPPNKHVFIYSGTPGRIKDKINIVLRDLYKLKEKDFIFNIVGITRTQFLVYYPELTSTLDGIGNKVNFLGRLPHKDCIKMIQNSSFQIFIRNNTRLNNAGFPTKFVESLACGTPVITSKISDLPNYLIEEKYGFFTAFNNKDTIYSTLKRVLDLSQEEIIFMKSLCLKCGDFDYNKFINVTREFLEKINQGDSYVQR